MQQLATPPYGLESGDFQRNSMPQMTSSINGLMRRNLLIVKVPDGSYVVPTTVLNLGAA
jgi:hypothetical protein